MNYCNFLHLSNWRFWLDRARFNQVIIFCFCQKHLKRHHFFLSLIRGDIHGDTHGDIRGGVRLDHLGLCTSWQNSGGLGLGCLQVGCADHDVGHSVQVSLRWGPTGKILREGRLWLDLCCCRVIIVGELLIFLNFFLLNRNNLVALTVASGPNRDLDGASVILTISDLDSFVIPLHVHFL